MQDILHTLAGTQCTECGYPSCAAYAEALLNPVTPRNLCRPGGNRTANALGSHLPPHQPPLPPSIAFVEEKDCIGCTICLQKCPTSAIVGTTKQIHTIVPSLCTGCNLCVPICPTQCISLQPAPKKHELTQQLPDGSLTLEASTKIWKLVEATESRPHLNRTLKTKAENPTVTLNALSPDLAAKILAAREKNVQKYAAKGPIRQPRALKTSK